MSLSLIAKWVELILSGPDLNLNSLNLTRSPSNLTKLAWLYSNSTRYNNHNRDPYLFFLFRVLLVLLSQPLRPEWNAEVEDVA